MVTPTSLLTISLVILLAHLPFCYSQSVGNCTNCELHHGVGYVAHPTDCTLFIQCQLGADGQPEVAGIHSCPHGLYWNPDKLTCDYVMNVDCVDDVCTGTLRTKVSGATCRGYWDCRSGTNVPLCCPLGTVYDPSTDQCVSQPDCQDDCLNSTWSNDTACPPWIRGVPGNMNVYEMMGPGTMWTLMFCPAGTGFTIDPCGCNLHIITPTTCSPELYLPFDTNHLDPTGRVWVGNQGVQVQNGAAYFDGSSRLTINRFSYAWWGSQVYINFRYLADSNATALRQALVTNGDCDVPPSLATCTVPNGVEFYADTMDNELPANFTVSNNQTSGWIYVSYELDYGRLLGQMDFETNKEVASGNLRSVQRALMIGYGGGCANFTGYIDDVYIYLCRPYVSMYGGGGGGGGGGF